MLASVIAVRGGVRVSGATRRSELDTCVVPWRRKGCDLLPPVVLGRRAASSAREAPDVSTLCAALKANEVFALSELCGSLDPVVLTSSDVVAALQVSLLMRAAKADAAGLVSLVQAMGSQGRAGDESVSLAAGHGRVGECYADWVLRRWWQLFREWRSRRGPAWPSVRRHLRPPPATTATTRQLRRFPLSSKRVQPAIRRTLRTVLWPALHCVLESRRHARAR